MSKFEVLQSSGLSSVGYSRIVAIAGTEEAYCVAFGRDANEAHIRAAWIAAILNATARNIEAQGQQVPGL